MKLEVRGELSVKVPVPRPGARAPGVLNEPLRVKELVLPARLTSSLPTTTPLVTVNAPTLATDPVLRVCVRKANAPLGRDDSTVVSCFSATPAAFRNVSPSIR